LTRLRIFLHIVSTQFIQPTTFLRIMNHFTISPRFTDFSSEDDERRHRTLARLDDDRIGYPDLRYRLVKMLNDRSPEVIEAALILLARPAEPGRKAA